MTWFDSSSPFATMFGSPVYPHAAQSMPRSRYGNVSHPHSRVVPVRDQDDDDDNSDYYDNGSSANDYFADLFGRPRYASQHHYQQQREQELRRQQQQQLLQQQQRRNQRTAQDEEMFEDEEDERRERMLDMQQRYQQKLRQQQEQQKLQQQKQKEQQQQQQQHFQQYPHPSSLSAAQRRKQQLVQQRQAEYEQAIEKQQRLLREQQQEQQQQQRMKRLRALQLRTANRAATTIQRALRAHQQRKQQARKAEAAATILRALQAWPQIRQARAAVQSLRQLARIRQQMALIAKPILEGQKGKQQQQQQQQHAVLHPINKENSITSTINKFNNLATTTTTTSNTTTTTSTATATATATAQTASKYSNVLSRKELLGMQDSIERAILSLDNVPTNGDAFIRSVRKDAVSEGQAYLQIIDERLNALSLAASRIQKWYRHMHAQRQLKTSDQAARRVARAMRSFPAIRTAKEQLQSLRQLRALHRQLLKVKEEFQGQLESISDSARKVPAFAETSAPHAELQFEIAHLLEALRQ